MLIHRSPGNSMISTCGSSWAGATSGARTRVRRPNGERGRLGITEGVLADRHRLTDSTRDTVSTHSSTHPEGWRDWPYEAPPTISRKRETVAIPSGSKTTAGEMWRRALPEPSPRTPRAEVQFH